MKRKNTKQRVSGENWIRRNYREVFSFMKESKNYFWTIIILLVISSLVGFFFPIFFIEQIKQIILSLVERTAGLSGINLIWFIFSNNLGTSFFGMLLGVFFGIFPIVVIIFNGYVLGFVARLAVEQEGVLILWRLLPHGIFEIPAVIISLGVGLRLGLFVFTKNKVGFWKFFLSCLKVFLFVILPLLIIAAIIEGSLIFLMK